MDGEFSPITVNKAFATRNYNNNRLGNPRRSNNAPTPGQNELNLNSTMSPSCGANMGSFKINLLRGDDDERQEIRVAGSKAGSTLAHQKAILGHPKILPRMNATPTMANFNKRQGYVQKNAPMGQAKRGTLQGIPDGHMLSQSPDVTMRGKRSMIAVHAERPRTPPQQVLEGFGDFAEDEPIMHHEGCCFLKTKTESFKKHWMVIIGNELYFYRKRGETEHKVMHCLTGTYLRDVAVDEISSKNSSKSGSRNGQKRKSYYPVKIVIPPNKSRLVFFATVDEQHQWIEWLQQAMGFTNVLEYYELGKTLGKGQFGLVKLAVHKKTGQQVAIKQVKKKNMTHIEVFQQRREIEVLKMCQHPNIINLVDIFENSEYYYIVLDYMEGSDLFDYLQARDFNLGEDRVRELTYQLVLGLKYLHNYGIVHRDLKLENIMMTDTSETSVPKLVDFGLAKMIGPNEKAEEPFGTLGYVAPEILEKKPYSFQCDMWSLGCIVYALLCSSLPFDHDSQKETIRMTCEDKVVFDSPQWKNYSRECMDLIFKLLIKKPEERITLEQSLAHPWFSGLSKAKRLVPWDSMLDPPSPLTRQDKQPEPSTSTGMSPN